MLSNFAGPLGIYANLDALTAAQASPAGPIPDPNPDAGPSFFYQWLALVDPRFFYPKDQSVGRLGVIVTQPDAPYLKSVGNVPTALATNNIAAAQNVTNGTPMTLAGSSLGITLNVPIVPFSTTLNGSAPVTAAIALDFGFAFGNCTAGSASIPVANAANFTVGMPLVIGGVGNSAGTAPLLTQVAAINTTTNTITVLSSAYPLATNATAPIGTGNLWSPTGTTGSGQPLLPTAAYPFLAAGPALLLDSGQTMCRGVQIVGSSGAAGGTFLVSGWDAYGMPLTQLITVAAGASTGWSLKTFKYIASVVPQFTDAHNYSVGTSDVFGFMWNAALFENTTIYWAGTLVTGTPTGFLAGVTTSPATNLTGDVRGTVQTSANGGGTGIGSTASNGSVSSLALTGNRLEMYSRASLRQNIYSTSSNATQLYGVTQA